MDWERLSKALRIQNWITLLILGGASFLFMSHTFTLGVILGGFIIISNFNLLQRTIRKAFSPQGVMQTNKIALIAKYYFRLAIMGIILYILITKGWVHPVGLVVGLSIVVISIIHIGIRAAWKISSGEAI